MEKQLNNAKSVRILMLPELSDDNKRSPLLPKVQANSPVNNRSTWDMSNEPSIWLNANANAGQ
jgi:hypothetical protein